MNGVEYEAVCPTCFGRVQSATPEGARVLADSHVQNHPGHRPSVVRRVDPESKAVPR